MDEYIVDVIINNKQEQLKTYSASQIEALDSMISFDGVDKIIKITRSNDNKSWDFDNSNLERLRDLRGLVDNDKLILQTLRGYN
jgi:hypothetical protein